MDTSTALGLATKAPIRFFRPATAGGFAEDLAVPEWRPARAGEFERRIAQFALDYAQQRGRRRVTAFHKANIMKLTDGLFLACAREVFANAQRSSRARYLVEACRRRRPA